ncbi:PREDICTED: uncharacterized protein LOC109228298 [Nicotiana attenuata]|uniref:uncharacterized protein LOC109228298 n=1 Tax=Nicotiana attenuata TaxID=49451 RepID=UPI00090474E1|nr:PREDICTED: uncharacterized protein LOC109228298 [Nicotiana attenuata]
MLLQRRTKKMELKKCNGSIKSVVDCPAERIKCPCDTILSKQTALTIRESSSDNAKVGTNHETPILSTPSNKGKEVGQSFCVFERGSTCGTSEGQQNAFVEVVSNKVGGCYEVNSLSSSFNTGKSISHPLCVFERGSTSETCKSQQDVSPEVFSNKGTSYEIPTLSAVFDKEKDVGHSFCVFERDQHPVHLRDNKMHLLKLLPIKFPFQLC